MYSDFRCSCGDPEITVPQSLQGGIKHSSVFSEVISKCLETIEAG